MRYATTLATAIPLLIATQSAMAQSRWSAELTGDAAIPTRTLAGADLKGGGGFGLNARYRFQPHLAAYAGWEWHMQQSSELLPGETLDLNDTGYALGLRFEHPMFSRAAWWVRGGGLVNHIEVEDSRGDIIDDTGHGLGWEVGGGLTIPLSTRFGLTPGIRYRSLSRDVTVGGATRPSTLSYVSTGLGFVFTF
jgi:hypothetical protein